MISSTLYFLKRRLSLIGPSAIAAIALATSTVDPATAQSNAGALTIRADIQQANANTGIVIAKGNVQMSYPARKIQATATQAQYFSRERRIILTGNVYVLQQGNSLRAETITYLIDEGRFVALPQPKQQVESIFLVPDANISTQADSAESR